jgi:hypothetical protein
MHAAMRGVVMCGMRGMQRGRSRGAYACGHAGSWNVRHAGHAVWKMKGLSAFGAGELRVVNFSLVLTKIACAPVNPGRREY